MRFILKQWYIRKAFGLEWKELQNYEMIFENFEVISEKDTENKRVGYLLTYNEKAIKIVYVNYKNEIRTKYIPISALAVVDDGASMLTQCLLYQKLNRKDQKEKCEQIVRECLKHASRWNDGYKMDNTLYR